MPEHYKVIRVKKSGSMPHSVIDDIGIYLTYTNNTERILDTLAIACEELNKEWPEREYVIALVVQKE